MNFAESHVYHKDYFRILYDYAHYHLDYPYVETMTLLVFNMFRLCHALHIYHDCLSQSIKKWVVNYSQMFYTQHV